MDYPRTKISVVSDVLRLITKIDLCHPRVVTVRPFIALTYMACRRDGRLQLVTTQESSQLLLVKRIDDLMNDLDSSTKTSNNQINAHSRIRNL